MASSGKTLPNLICKNDHSTNAFKHKPFPEIITPAELSFYIGIALALYNAALDRFQNQSTERIHAEKQPNPLFLQPILLFFGRGTGLRRRALVDQRDALFQRGGSKNLVLLAWVQIKTRRVPDSNHRGMVMKRTDSIQIGDVVIDFNRNYIMRKGKITYLRGTSLNLLRYFIENANALLTRDALLVHVWGYCGSNITRTVDMHVSKLRKAIEPDPRHPQHILTVQGQGYKFIGDTYAQKSLSA